MNKEHYTSFELSILSFFLLNSFTSTILLKTFNGKSTTEIIVEIILAFLLGFLFLSFYFSLFREEGLFKEKSLISTILKVILFSSSFFLAIYSIDHVAEFIKEVILPGTSKAIIELSFLVLCTILVKNKTKSIVIASNLLFFVYVIVSFSTLIFNLFEMDPINLLPITTTIEHLDFSSLFFLTFSPMFLLLVIPKKDIANFSRFRKNCSIFYTIFFIYFLLKILFIVSILGMNYFSILEHPEINVLKMIHIFNFFERLEELFLINIFIQNFITTSFSLNYLSILGDSFLPFGKYNLLVIDIVVFLVLLKGNFASYYPLLWAMVVFIIANLLTLQKNTNRKQKSG